jgi:hypothetical protein
MNLGIDKIALTTRDFSVNNITKELFAINPNTKQGGGELPIFTDLSGQKLEANSYNHFSKKIGAYYGVNKHGLKIEFNPSNIYHPYNLITAGEQLNQTYNLIQKDLKNIGINVDLSEMKTTRVDIASQDEMQHHPLIYSNAFRQLNGNRQSKKEEPNSFYFQNKEHQVCFYNKREQLLDKYGNGYELNVPKNFMRAEIRALKSGSVLRNIGIKKASEILLLDFDTCKNIRDDYMNKNIFNLRQLGKQQVINFESELKQWQHTRERFPKGYLKHYLALNGVNELLLRFGGFEGIGLFLREAGESRKVINSHLKYLKTLVLERAFLTKESNEITTEILIKELAKKFAA